MHLPAKRRSRRTVLGPLALLAVFASPLTSAATCYVVLDHSDSVIYQGVSPPVDMSAAGAASRDAMKRRGEFIEVFESQACPERSVQGSAKGEASVDEIVSAIKPYRLAGRRDTAMPQSGERFVKRDSDVISLPVN